LLFYILQHVNYAIPVVREINHGAVLYNKHVMPYGHSSWSKGEKLVNTTLSLDKLDKFLIFIDCLRLMTVSGIKLFEHSGE